MSDGELDPASEDIHIEKPGYLQHMRMQEDMRGLFQQLYNAGDIIIYLSVWAHKTQRGSNIALDANNSISDSLDPTTIAGSTTSQGNSSNVHSITEDADSKCTTFPSFLFLSTLN